MKKFKYDVTELISCIRERPCLWDKSLGSYKDRVERRSAWEEIFNILDDDYENMTAEERRVMGEGVIYKWTNIRDTFMKSLKIKLGKPKRPYMLHNELKFLKKNLQPEGDYQEDDDSSSYFKQEVDDSMEVVEEPIRKKSRKSVDSFNNSKNRGSRRRSKRSVADDVDSSSKNNSDDYNADCEVASDPRVMNEDEAFFASLLPTVVKYDEDDKLEFRMGVLEVMKNINKARRKWSIDQD